MNAFDDAKAALDKTRFQQNKRLILLLIYIIIGLLISLFLELTLLVILILLVGATIFLDRSQRSKKHWKNWKIHKGVLTSARTGIGLFSPSKALPENRRNQK